MFIIAIDTSQPEGSVTIAKADGIEVRPLATQTIQGGTFSAQLIPVISDLLQQQGGRPEDIVGLCVSVGPGSFTGLRIGLAAVKGLAEVLVKPVAAISALEALVHQAPTDGTWAAVMDARRGEFYLGEYSRVGATVARLSESLCSLDELQDAVRERGAQIISVRPVPPALKDVFPTIVEVDTPGSLEIAKLGARKLHSNQTTSVEALDAVYLRRDEALFFRSKPNETPSR